MLSDRIHSPRLLLTRLTFDQLRQLCVGDGIGQAFVPGFLAEPGALDVYIHEAGGDAWWLPYLIKLRDSGLVIGLCGHKGRPDGDGAVEIAYSIAPIYRSQGFAREAVMALCDESLRVETVKRIRAHTLPERNASARVLEHGGFVRAGEALDSEEGLLWRWEKR